MKRLQFWVGIAISLLFLWWALRELKLAEVWEALRTARYSWIIPGVLIYFGVWARTWRWHYMLRPFKSVTLVTTLPGRLYRLHGQQHLSPSGRARSSAPLSSRQTEDIPISGSLATVLVERIFDGLVMLLFVFVALPFTDNIPDIYRTWVIGVQRRLFGVALVVIHADGRSSQTERALLRLRSAAGSSRYDSATNSAICSTAS